MPQMSPIGAKIDAYKNITDDCVSVRSREAETRGRVIEHVDAIVVADATFEVSETMRKRVLEEERKNVHAVVRGQWADHELDTDECVAITYNPYKYESFVTREDERPVEAAEWARVTTDGVQAVGVKYE